MRKTTLFSIILAAGLGFALGYYGANKGEKSAAQIANTIDAPETRIAKVRDIVPLTDRKLHGFENERKADLYADFYNRGAARGTEAFDESANLTFAERRVALMAIVDGTMAKSPDAALQFLREGSDAHAPYFTEELLRRVGSSLGATGRGSALIEDLDAYPARFRLELAKGVYASFEDSGAFEREIARLSKSDYNVLNREMLRTLFREWGEHDPSAAIERFGDYRFELPVIKMGVARDMLNGIIGNSPDAAFEAAKALSDSGVEDALSVFLHEYIDEADPVVALEWIAARDNFGLFGDAALLELGTRVSATDPEATLEIASAIVDAQKRSDLLGRAVARFAEEDARGTIDWIDSSFPEEAKHDAWTAAVLAGFDYRSPDEGLAALRSVEDAAARNDAAFALMMRWKGIDREVALEKLSSLSDAISPETADNIRRFLQL